MVAPYLDMGNNQPASLYAAIRSDHLKAFSAGFVIGNGCTPAWDDSIAVSRDTAVNRAVTKAKRLGAKVVISFGGQGGLDLARSCTSTAKVLAGYQAVVRRFHPAYVDFDIEGASLRRSQLAAAKRRFAAIRGLERANPELVVSLTEPVAPTGLPDRGSDNVMALLREAKAAHVRVDLLNLMTMDYFLGEPTEMGADAISATKDSLQQVRQIWSHWSYAKLGITPMIGLNDDTSETFTLSDAARVTRFARSHHVGRVAFWAMGRDRQCTGATTPAQYNCSSVSQAPLAFTKAFLG
jgi:chitinase